MQLTSSRVLLLPRLIDEEGALYVLDNANTTAGGGTIVKVVNGVLDTITQDAIWGVQDMSLVSDGRGGLWVSQNRGQIDGCYQLVHYNKSGIIDYSVYDAIKAANPDDKLVQIKSLEALQ